VIPDSVRKFIADHIDSVEQLEVLILLREHRDRAITVEAINTQIRSSTTSVRGRLDALVRRGLVEQEGTVYRYAPPAELDGVMAELTRNYAEQRFTVIELIFARPTDKLRAFADAFRVGTGKSKKGKSDG
jgi:hypothetical protein